MKNRKSSLELDSQARVFGAGRAGCGGTLSPTEYLVEPCQTCEAETGSRMETECIFGHGAMMCTVFERLVTVDRVRKY